MKWVLRGRPSVSVPVVVAAFALLIVLGHNYTARRLVDEGIAGALLAGGGEWTTVAAAAGFVLLRLAVFAGLAMVPAVVVWWLWPRTSTR